MKCSNKTVLNVEVLCTSILPLAVGDSSFLFLHDFQFLLFFSVVRVDYSLKKLLALILLQKYYIYLVH
jgi:hypothetical protein